ncbi:hypothetical protein CVT24_009333 [Panaeolus cyanescens]|uniref:Uncharacterized protein n=1 Tax=Panaeolus cyanescens TaxID=181874 RepID=A0A409Y8C7_9AGAR|nr:hypothetical protein CVT24_009333 [Panaeolus cyanescens]
MPETNRPRSVRSVASNSSIASANSAASLSRRPRINRSRSKTVTGASDHPIPSQSTTTSNSDLPYLAPNSPQEHPELLQAFSFPLVSANKSIPIGASSKASSMDKHELRSSDTASSQGGTANDATMVEPLNPPPAPIEVPKPIKSGPNLPLLDTGYRPPPSAFSRDPALTPINIRDSVSTNQSGISSSLYPPSTSTASGPESPTSPPYLEDNFPSIEQPPFSMAPEVNEVQDYDSDDVSYRLRLLVKNNYFLPPAHSKPSPADFASANPNPPKKSTSPAFLDIFRVGKSKSKPTTPTLQTPGFDAMRRTTPDAITPAYGIRSQQPRSSTQLPRLSPGLPNAAPRGRVVVVREKMHDIAVAAKQAEQDMKTRGARLEQGSQKAKPDPVDDVIDPTDAVDVPLPDPNYPFAVQASALHGLGVLESVGADVLADRLPPPKNPNLSSTYDPMEDTWRKALLHEAVHHSLDNTPDVSTFSHILGTSTPLVSSPTPREVETLPALTASQKAARLQQKIMPEPLRESPAAAIAAHARKASGSSQVSTSQGGNTTGGLSVQQSKLLDSSRPSSFLPQRVETPTGPLTPLGPPPRRYFVNPLFSLSQTDLSPTSAAHPPPSPLHSASPHPTLRRTVSTPSFAEGYESATARQDLMSPPPIPNPYRDSTLTSITYDVRKSYDSASRGTSIHHDYDAAMSHASLDLATMRSRPSLSEYSQSSMSPTTSAFQEMLNQEDLSGNFTVTAQAPAPVPSTSSEPRPIRASADGQRQSGSRPSTAELRYTAVSPPPRTSSQLAHNALPPPPRFSAFNRPPLPSSSLATTSESSHSTPPRHAGQPIDSPMAADTTFSINEPEPITPPLPLSGHRDQEQQGNDMEMRSTPTPSRSRTHPPLTLDIPTVRIPVAIHSAPGPSSPTNFFDTIQSHPNAMDDLESSSEDEDGEEDVDEEMQEFAERQAHQHQILMEARNRSYSVASVANNTPPSAIGMGITAPSMLGLRMGRPGIMKHNNFSTPYLRHGDVSASSFSSHSSAWKALESHQPVSNTPNRKTPIGNVPVGKGVASGSGSKDGGDPVSNSYDFFRYAQEHPAPTFASLVKAEEEAAKAGRGQAEAKRPATADHVMTWRKDQKAQESLRRLDGMLLQHMEDEKEAIKRIATGLQQQRQQNGVPVQGKWQPIPSTDTTSNVASGSAHGPMTLGELGPALSTRNVSSPASQGGLSRSTPGH